MEPAKLYFDGQCPLCRAEMTVLRRSAGADLCLVDIHDQPGADAERQRLLRRLHYISGNGEVITGLAANIAAWQHTRRGFLWRWLNWPVIRLLAGWVYDQWADHRYRRRYGKLPHE